MLKSISTVILGKKIQLMCHKTEKEW